MTALVTGLLAILIAYLLGAIPFGYLLTRFTTGKDVRSEGSGNIGATNVLRTAGRGAGVATLVLDMAKGYAAVWIAGMLTDGSSGWMADAALAVMVGHAFPIFLGFKGGKAVATFFGAFLYLTPIPALAAADRVRDHRYGHALRLGRIDTRVRDVSAGRVADPAFHAE